MIFGKRRFAEAIERQLDLFEQDHSGLLSRIEDAHDAYTSAGADPEELYSEFLDLVELATDELGDVRDAYASTLDPEAAAEYEAAFDGAVRRRFRILRAGG